MKKIWFGFDICNENEMPSYLAVIAYLNAKEKGNETD